MVCRFSCSISWNHAWAGSKSGRDTGSAKITPMGKRQTRIFRKDIPQHVQQLLAQKSVQVVLRNKVVLTGLLLQVSPEQLQLQDYRFHKHTLPVEQVEEIIYDTEAAY